MNLKLQILTLQLNILIILKIYFVNVFYKAKNLIFSALKLFDLLQQQYLKKTKEVVI